MPGNRARGDGQIPVGGGHYASAVVPDPDEQRLISRVRELWAEGASYRTICRQLEDEEFRPQRAEHWQPAVVRRIAVR